MGKDPVAALAFEAQDGDFRIRSFAFRIRLSSLDLRLVKKDNLLFAFPTFFHGPEPSAPGFEQLLRQPRDLALVESLAFHVPIEKILQASQLALARRRLGK